MAATDPQQPAQRYSLRPILLPAYGPTAFASIGTGATLPVLVLSVRDLGGGVEVAALIVALLGIGQLLADLPAGALAARIGEQRALKLAAVGQAAAMGLCWFAPEVWTFGAAVFLLGTANAVFGLARQAYLTEAVPVQMRARALSTLGGVHRIGVFVGPFLGAGVMTLWGLGAAYAVGLVAGLIALAILYLTPDIAAGHSSAGTAQPQPSVVSVLNRHRPVLLTVGLGVLVIAAVRQSRNVILPLWGEAIGLDAATTALVFGISGGVDMLLFYPAGWVMDRWGRLMVALPALALMGLGLMLVPLTGSFWQLTWVGVLLGVGNGISAGIVMTLGSDLSPHLGRAQFLGGWRLTSDSGAALGPVAISGVVALTSLGWACVGVGLLAWCGAAWMRVWIPRHDPITRATMARSRRRRT